MRSRISFLASVFLLAFGSSAYANWEYPGYFVGDGIYEDDGSRIVISFRGGASLVTGKVKNEIGTMTADYYYNEADGSVVTGSYCENFGCDGYVFAGIGEMASLPATKNLSDVSFTAGASIGWTIPYHSQWRLELGWDTIQETEYTAMPLFEGDMALTGGEVPDIVIHVPTGGVQSEVGTDIISAMAYYDFYDGLYRPAHKAIPYIGFGIGYADTKTTMNLVDLYGDLSTALDLGNFGKIDENGILQFYRSETNTSNIAGVLALGISYGITENFYLDFGAKAIYLPRIRWALTNEDNTRQRDWFSAENIFYTNITLGIRFEF